MEKFTDGVRVADAGDGARSNRGGGGLPWETPLQTLSNSI
jgi:hypothetical protein